MFKTGGSIRIDQRIAVHQRSTPLCRSIAIANSGSSPAQAYSSLGQALLFLDITLPEETCIRIRTDFIPPHVPCETIADLQGCLLGHRKFIALDVLPTA